MIFFVLTVAPLFLPSLSASNFSYDGSNGPSHWGNEYKTCQGKFQSPIDIEEKDVTNATFPLLQYSGLEHSHTAFMTNNGHTGMKQQGQDIDEHEQPVKFAGIIETRNVMQSGKYSHVLLPLYKMLRSNIK